MRLLFFLFCFFFTVSMSFVGRAGSVLFTRKGGAVLGRSSITALLYPKTMGLTVHQDKMSETKTSL